MCISNLFGGGSGDIDLEWWVSSFVGEPGGNISGSSIGGDGEDETILMREKRLKIKGAGGLAL